ncbi:MAG TPA: ATP-binding protein [Nitrospira sp.]|nr:ATP-binding protein [Nitrospira sp.]
MRKHSTAKRGRMPRRNLRPGAVMVLSGGTDATRRKAAQILSDQLERELLRVDLSALVSQYIGETEKNLDRLFEKAERAGTILFVDEADALFNARPSDSGARNRDNSASLVRVLRRIEDHPGLIIMACNAQRRVAHLFSPRKAVVVLEAKRQRKNE